jgi:hypothetical protein
MSSSNRVLENLTRFCFNSAVNICVTQRQWCDEKHKDPRKCRCTVLGGIQSSWPRVRTEYHGLFLVMREFECQHGQERASQIEGRRQCLSGQFWIHESINRRSKDHKHYPHRQFVILAKFVLQ